MLNLTMTDKILATLKTMFLLCIIVSVMLITYKVTKNKYSKPEGQTNTISTPSPTKPIEYKASSGVSTANIQDVKKNHENLQDLIDAINVTIKLYEYSK